MKRKSNREKFAAAMAAQKPLDADEQLTLPIPQDAPEVRPVSQWQAPEGHRPHGGRRKR